MAKLTFGTVLGTPWTVRNRRFATSLREKCQTQGVTNKPNDSKSSIIQVSFPPERVRRLLLNIKANLGRDTGQTLSFDDWGRLTGRPGNTLASWCEDGAAHQLQALMASLERLPSAQRHQLIDEACRAHPTLRHPKLAHDFVAVTYLMRLLNQRSGFTAIQGNPAHMRTFLLTALGNSFQASNPQGGVGGIDIHSATFLTPILRVIYLDNPLGASEVAEEIQRAWPRIARLKARLFVFNDVWTKAGPLQTEIVGLARRAHVVVADSGFNGAVRRIHVPVHLLTVSAARENPEWIRVDVQQI